MQNPVKLAPHPKYPDMFYLEWEDGVLSADFYNLTRANDILKYYDGYTQNYDYLEETRKKRGRVKV